MALQSQIEAAARGDAKPATGNVFDRRLSHIVDATPAQWATFTVDVITRARRIEMPREELLQVLSILGITDGVSKRRGFDGKAIVPRGRCQVCKTMQDLRTDGKVRSHKIQGEYCTGRYQEPMAEPEQVAS